MVTSITKRCIHVMESIPIKWYYHQEERPRPPKSDDAYIGSLLDIKCTTTIELSRDLAAAIGKEFPGKLYTDV